MAQGDVVLKMTSDEAHLFRGLQRLVAQQKRVEDGFRGIRRSGREAAQAGEAFGSNALDSLFKYAAGIASVSTAINTLQRAYTTWRDNLREIAEVARTAGDAVIDLAMLQQPGRMREALTRTLALGQKYGIQERPEVIETVQSLQTQYQENLDKGLAAAEEIFKATLVGVSVRDAREIAIQQISQGFDVVPSMRRVLLAGKASARSPRDIAKAGPALRFFDDPDIAFAAAATILPSIDPGEIQTFVKAAGIGISGYDDPKFRRYMKRLKVDKADPITKLRALAAAGMTTPEKLATKGLTDIRQLQAVATLVKNVDEVERILGVIRAGIGDTVVEKTRASIVAEMPEVWANQRIAGLRAAAKDEQAFGRFAIRGQQKEEAELVRGLAFRRLGIEEIGPFDVIDAEGRSTQVSEFLFDVARWLGIGKPGMFAPTEGGGSPLDAEKMRVIRDKFGETQDEYYYRWGKAVDDLNKAAVELRGAAESLGKGSTLAKPDEDR